MSIISRLTTVAAAGAGGAANFSAAFTDNAAYQSSMTGADVALDSNGNVWLVGKVTTSTRYNYLIQIDQTGAVLQTKRVDNNGTSAVEFYAIAIDSSDNIYLCGRDNQPTGNQFPCVVKLNSSLSIQWAKQYKTSSTSDRGIIYGCFLDSSGANLFTGGNIDVSGVGVGGSMMKISTSDGSLQFWKRTEYSSPVQSYPFDVVVDSTGTYAVYVGADYTLNKNMVWVFNASTGAYVHSAWIGNATYSFGTGIRCFPDDSGRIAIGWQYSDGTQRFGSLLYNPATNTAVYSTAYSATVSTGQGISYDADSGKFFGLGRNQTTLDGVSAYYPSVISLSNSLTYSAPTEWLNSYGMRGGSWQTSLSTGYIYRAKSTGTHLVSIGTWSNYVATSGGANQSRLLVVSQKLDGSGGGSYDSGNLVVGSPATVNSGTAATLTSLSNTVTNYSSTTTVNNTYTVADVSLDYSVIGF